MTSAIAVLLLALSSNASAQSASISYWLRVIDDGHTWCGYADSAEFKSKASIRPPQESARATYSSGKLTEVTVQVAPESGDWIVIDAYTPADSQLVLRRANLLVQAQLRIVQVATIRGGKAGPFRIESVTTFDGTKAKLPVDTDFPRVAVRTDLSRLPFMAIVTEMRNRSIGELCRVVQ